MANKRKIIVQKIEKKQIIAKLFFTAKVLTLLPVIHFRFTSFPNFIFLRLSCWTCGSGIISFTRDFSLKKPKNLDLCKENLKCDTNGGFSVFIHSRKNNVLIFVEAYHIVSRTVLLRS
jgi:hypothetical protein